MTAVSLVHSVARAVFVSKFSAPLAATVVLVAVMVLVVSAPVASFCSVIHRGFARMNFVPLLSTDVLVARVLPVTIWQIAVKMAIVWPVIARLVRWAAVARVVLVIQVDAVSIIESALITRVFPAVPVLLMVLVGAAIAVKMKCAFPVVWVRKPVVALTIMLAMPACNARPVSASPRRVLPRVRVMTITVTRLAAMAWRQMTAIVHVLPKA